MRFAAAIAAVLLLAGCSGYGNRHDVIVEHFGNIADAQWVYSSPVEMKADSLPDSIAQGILMVSIRHTADYPYRNIWLEVTQEHFCLPQPNSAACVTPDKSCIRRDTFEIMLADIYGRWYGSGMGTSLRLTDTLSTDYDIARGANVSLRQIMRTDTLKGVEQVGFILIAK